MSGHLFTHAGSQSSSVSSSTRESSRGGFSSFLFTGTAVAGMTLSAISLWFLWGKKKFPWSQPSPEEEAEAEAKYVEDVDVHSQHLPQQRSRQQDPRPQERSRSHGRSNSSSSSSSSSSNNSRRSSSRARGLVPLSTSPRLLRSSGKGMSLFSARPLQDDSNASGRYSDKRSSSSSSSSRSTRGHSRKTKSNDAIFDFFLTMHGKLDDMNNKSTSKPQQKKKKGRRYSTSTTHAAHQLNLSPISVNQHPSQARLAKRRQFRQQARLSSYSHGNDIPTRSQSDLFYLESTVGSTDMESSGNDQEYGYLSHSDADGESSDLNY